MPRENKHWSRCPQQLSGLSLCGTQLNTARCLCREKVGKDRPGTGHSKSITQCHKANRERGRSPPRLAWSTTWQVRTAVQKAIVFKKKKRAGRRKIYIHACQNRQRTAETILKCTKILKHYVCTSNYQHWRSNTLGEQTHRKRDEICGYQAQSGGGAGGRWSKVQTCSCKVSTTDVMYTMTNVINMLHVTYELRVNPKGFHHKENNFFVLFCIYETMDIH